MTVNFQCSVPIINIILVITFMQGKQTTLLGYTVLQLFCIYNFYYR